MAKRQWTYGVDQLVMGLDGPQRSNQSDRKLQAATGPDGLFSPDAEIAPGVTVRVRQGLRNGNAGGFAKPGMVGGVSNFSFDLMNSQVRTTVAREWIEIKA